MLEIYQGPLPTQHIYDKWEKIAKEHNIGAMCVFTGIVRAENGIQALSFDIYEPLLHKWFEQWEIKAKAQSQTLLFMAHARGDVPCGQSSYMCGILSSQRKGAFEVYETFIEDFKANAPIWKYDIIDHHRIYAKDRSKPLAGSGLLR